MRNFRNVTCEYLAEFTSEKIGHQWYYFCTMQTKDKDMAEDRAIRYTIMFDADDLYETLDDDAVATDEDVEDYANDLCYCHAEMLASLPSMTEIIKSANKSIQEYNNGARFQIADNYDMEDMADAVTESISKADILAIIRKAEDNGTSFIDEGETIYWQIDEVVENYCDDHELFVVDTMDVIDLIN